MEVVMSKTLESRMLIVVAALGLALVGGCSRDGTPTAGPLPPTTAVAASVAKKASRTELATHRKLQIQRLHAYMLAAKFPHNPSASKAPIHMFRDDDGNRCAVANLIFEDGHVALVDRMAKEHNDVVVADETAGPLHDWVLTSGLTNEEVRRIQGVGFPGEGGLFAPGGGVVPSVLARLDLQAHLQTVEQELVDATEASLDVALQRLEGRTVAGR
jgi:hypothetical protein